MHSCFWIYVFWTSMKGKIFGITQWNYTKLSRLEQLWYMSFRSLFAKWYFWRETRHDNDGRNILKHFHNNWICELSQVLSNVILANQLLFKEKNVTLLFSISAKLVQYLWVVAFKRTIYSCKMFQKMNRKYFTLSRFLKLASISIYSFQILNKIYKI